MTDNNQLDRFFNLLQEQGKTLAKQGETLARMDQSMSDTHERLFGGGNTPGAIPYLYTQVEKHSRQITFWKGAIAVLTFFWGVGVTYASGVLIKRR